MEVILIVVGVLGKFPKILVKTGGIRNQRKK